jgi:hypothetical protein
MSTLLEQYERSCGLLKVMRREVKKTIMDTGSSSGGDITRNIVFIASRALDGVASRLEPNRNYSHLEVQHIHDLVEVLVRAHQSRSGGVICWTRAHVSAAAGVTLQALRSTLEGLDSSAASNPTLSHNPSLCTLLPTLLSGLGYMAHHFVAEENAALYCAVVSEDIVSCCWVVCRRAGWQTSLGPSLGSVIQFLHVCVTTSQHAVAWNGTLRTSVVGIGRRQFPEFDILPLLNVATQWETQANSLQLVVFRWLSSHLRAVRKIARYAGFLWVVVSRSRHRTDILGINSQGVVTPDELLCSSEAVSALLSSLFAAMLQQPAETHLAAISLLHDIFIASIAAKKTSVIPLLAHPLLKAGCPGLLFAFTTSTNDALAGISLNVSVSPGISCVIQSLVKETETHLHLLPAAALVSQLP